MARKQKTQRPDPPRTTATSRTGPPVPRGTIGVLVTSLIVACWAAMLLTPAAQIVYVSLFIATEFYAGVVTLVTLTLTVLAGVAATDRSVLMIRHRVVLQSTHRALGVVAVAMLGLHVLSKIATARAGLLDPVLPFVSGAGLYVGLGTLAGYGMFAVLWTGIIRLRFAGRGWPWMWRALHSTAYVSWPFALVHGLNAGRTPATWVTLSYLSCVLLVVAALLVRLTASLGRRRREMVGTPVVTATVVAEQATDRDRAAAWVPGRRAVSEPRVGRDMGTEPEAVPAALLDSWQPAASYRNVAQPRRRGSRFAVPQVPGYVDDEPPAWRADDVPAATGPAVLGTDVPEEPWTSPRRWSTPTPTVVPVVTPAPEPVGNYWEAPDLGRRPGADAGADTDTGVGRRVIGRHSHEDEDVAAYPRPIRGVEAVAAYLPPARDAEKVATYPPDIPGDDTPTLVDLASRRARRKAEGGSGTRTARRRRPAVAGDPADSAYWAQLRGEAK